MLASTPAAATAAASVAASNPGSPVPPAHSMSEKTAFFMEAPLRGFVRQLPRLLEVMEVRPGMHVADVGAGTGIVTEALARAVSASTAQYTGGQAAGAATAAASAVGKVYTLDVTPFFLHGLRARKQRLCASTDASTAAAGAAISVHAIGLTDIGGSDIIPDGSLDLIFLADVLHHLSDAAATLSCVARALKPGSGRVVVLESDRVKYMEAVATAHPVQFQSLLRENMRQGGGGRHAHSHSHSHSRADGDDMPPPPLQEMQHGHDHSHGQVAVAAAPAHSHSHSHSHSHAHSLAHGHSHNATTGAAASLKSPLLLSSEEAVALARKVSAGIPPEDPARLVSLMAAAGLIPAATHDLAPTLAFDDLHFALAFARNA